MKLGLGTAAIGRPLYININQEKRLEFSMSTFRQNGIDILDFAYDQGVRYYDTAPGYGMAEQLLIDWAHSKNDDEIEIATKWGYTYIANYNPQSKIHEVKEHSLAKLQEQWQQSKKLLPYLTTYQIHSATLASGVLDNLEILEYLAQLKNHYKIKIGITATGNNQIDIIKKALTIHIEDTDLFDVFQFTYNVFDQSVANIKDLLHNKKIIIKEALANGRVLPNESYPIYSPIYKQLKTLSDKYQVGIDAIALRFCIDTLPVYSILSGASNNAHLSANLKTLQFQLTNEEINLLRNMSVKPKDYWDERAQLTWN